MKYLIVGLGNIGDEYSDTRHNIGFVVADAVALSLKSSFEPGRHASVAKGKLKGKSVTVIKPSTYMNLSGKALRYWMNQEKIPPENILVIVDDLALPLGALRLRKRGSDGGHNGLISIIETIETTEFSRLRVGIGNDFAKGSQVDYVLGRWSKEEEKILIPRINTAVEMIQCFILQGVDKAMNQYNS
ncbi:MAG: aminoacyl-tRNA hydrolase [Bacteroidales bacterium]|nr:aminoacyl-tRNA hydrolase [Bacteroidales bacterium]